MAANSLQNLGGAFVPNTSALGAAQVVAGYTVAANARRGCPSSSSVTRQSNRNIRDGAERCASECAPGGGYPTLAKDACGIQVVTGCVCGGSLPIVTVDFP